MSATPAAALESAVPEETHQPDVLRKERFGALYYARPGCRFFTLKIPEARLLIAATQENLLEAYAREPSLYRMTEAELVARVIRWRREGLLDDDFRCGARVVDVDRGHGGLGAPMITHLQLTRACNSTCRHCYVPIAARPAPDELRTDQVLNLFRELNELGCPRVVLAGGEPLMRPDLEEILTGVGRFDLDGWLCTNATLVTEPLAEMIASAPLRGVSVSLDGSDARTHDALRGEGHFVRAARGAKLLSRAGAKGLQLRVTVTDHSVRRLGGLAQLADDVGASKVTVKPFLQVGAAIAASDLLINRELYENATTTLRQEWPENACRLEVDNAVPVGLPAWTRIMPAFGCVGGNTSVEIAFDGRVLACGSVRDEDTWSLHEKSFTDCWQRSPALNRWRNLEPSAATREARSGLACAGGCRTRAIGAGGSIADPDPWLRVGD